MTVRDKFMNGTVRSLSLHSLCYKLNQTLLPSCLVVLATPCSFKGGDVVMLKSL